MNIYTQVFEANCPANGNRIKYAVRIESATIIMVEQLQEFIAGLSGYHETIADALFAKFGGRQTINADHHGTHIQTVRP